MSAKDKREFILLSELISKLKDNDYYLTYAKSLVLTENISDNPIEENELISEMFNYFISANELNIYRNEANQLEDEKLQQTSLTTENSYHQIEKPIISEIQHDSIFIKIKDLKKLYANKCIVFPSSLLN